MDKTRCQLEPGVWLDYRRAVWLEEPRVLAVADLHLGYLWAQRKQGQMLPLGAPDDTFSRLAELQECYRPREIAVLGDVVHQALKLDALTAELQRLCRALSVGSRLRLIAGNHDRRLNELLAHCELDVSLEPAMRAGDILLTHGDSAPEEPTPGGGSGLRVIMGHEHPAIAVGDGVATSIKCPCFLASRDTLALPAFSPWAGGSLIRRNPFMSPSARAASFHLAVAIMGRKLLPIPLAQANKF